MSRAVFVLTILACVVVLGGQPAAAATVYMGPNEAHKTLRQAFAAMKGGDTLVIRDGVYTGPDNMINYSNAGGGQDFLPPPGTPGAYTIVRAEHEGQVTFDGELVRPTFAVTEWSAVLTYVEFHGLKWVRSAVYGPVFLIRNPGAGAKGVIAYVKFFRCGAHQPSALPWDTTWGIRAGDHLLFEECYAWGATRYLFMVSNSSAEGAHKIVFRRCVARHDDVRGNANAVAGFMSYTAPEVEWQNCIYLDADTSRWTSWVNGQGFATRIHGDNTNDNYSEDLRYRGNIVLNLKGWGWPDAGGGENYATAYLVVSPRAGHPNLLEQNVAWDVMHGLRVGISDGGSTIDGLTVYCANDPAYPAVGSGVRALSNGGGYPTWPTRNYVAIGHTPSLRYAEALVAQMATDYGAVYTNAAGPANADFATFNGLNGPGAHDYTQRITSVDGRVGDKGRTDHLTNNEINPFTGDPVAPSTLDNGVPALKYLVRVEPGSTLYGTGENGAHRGATILKRYGVAGSLWGDPGYNTLTEDSLWPFPYEARDPRRHADLCARRRARRHPRLLCRRPDPLALHLGLPRPRRPAPRRHRHDWRRCGHALVGSARGRRPFHHHRLQRLPDGRRAAGLRARRPWELDLHSDAGWDGRRPVVRGDDGGLGERRERVFRHCGFRAYDGNDYRLRQHTAS